MSNNSLNLDTVNMSRDQKFHYWPSKAQVFDSDTSESSMDGAQHVFAYERSREFITSVERTQRSLELWFKEIRVNKNWTWVLAVKS